jgi:cytoskeletal protein RodZ
MSVQAGSASERGSATEALAGRHREQRRRHVRRIRRAVCALALALFSAAFLTVYVQLASGHDPALTAASRRHAIVAAKAASATSSSSAESPSSESTSSESTSEETPTSESAGEEAGGTPSALTTSQS